MNKTQTSDKLHNILFICGFAPSLVNFRSELLYSLIKKKYNVYATAPPNTEAAENLKKIGVKFIPSPLKRTSFNIFNDLNFLIFLYKILKSNRIGIVFSYTHKSVIYSGIIANFAREIKFCSMITGFGYTFLQKGFKGKFLELLMRALFSISLRNSYVTFFQNRDLLDYFKRKRLLNRRKSHVLINGSGVNLLKFSKKNHSQSITFLMISRLLIDKGVVEYIKAANIVKKKYPKTIFNLIGNFDSNPSSLSNEKLIRLNNLNSVNYLGFKDDVRPNLAKSSVYVLPSYGEGMPRTVLEALSTGRAIITTNTPGCRESIKNNVHGFIVPPRDSKSLAEAMIKFIENKNLIVKMGAEGRKLAEKKFDVYKINRIILKFLI